MKKLLSSLVIMLLLVCGCSEDKEDIEKAIEYMENIDHNNLHSIQLGLNEFTSFVYKDRKPNRKMKKEFRKIVDSYLSHSEIENIDINYLKNNPNEIHSYTGFINRLYENEKYLTDEQVNKLLDKTTLNELNLILSKYDNEKMAEIERDIKNNQSQKIINITKEVYEPFIGMTDYEALESTWGKPNDINRTTTINGVYEQWVYSGDRYLYFENNHITSIQE